MLQYLWEKVPFVKSNEQDREKPKQSKQKKQQKYDEDDKFLDKKEKELQKAINFNKLVEKIKKKYGKYLKTNEKKEKKSQNSLHTYYHVVRNIFGNIIAQNLLLANQDQITIKQCQIQISKKFLEVLIFILKRVKRKNPKSDLTVINFMKINDRFLIKLVEYLQTANPRSQIIQCGQLANELKQFDQTERYDYDILKNAGVVLTGHHQDYNTIKLFMNKIIRQIEMHFSKFSDLMKEITSENNRVRRRISQNTPKYFTLNTGTIEINSIQVQKVFIDWMEDLFATINNLQGVINEKNQFKLYKKKIHDDQIKFEKCQIQVFNKFKGQKLMQLLNQYKQKFQQKYKQQKYHFRQFNLNILKILNQFNHNNSEVSKDQIEIIKFSAYNNLYIQYLVIQYLRISIFCFADVTQEIQQSRGTLDVIKFRIYDLLRSNVVGQKEQLLQIYHKLKHSQKQNKIEIIKITNKLQTPLNSASIYFKIKQSFIIFQMKLIIQNKNHNSDEKTSHNMQQINHYLNQLRMSPFGVLSQLSIFLSKNSNLISNYESKIKMDQEKIKKIEKCIQSHCKYVKGRSKEEQQQQTTKQQIEEGLRKQNRNPFVCNKCQRYNPKFTNQIQVHQCPQCQFKICNFCSNDRFYITTARIKHYLSKRVQESIQQFKATPFYKQSMQISQDDFQKCNIFANQLIANDLNILSSNDFQKNMKKGKIKVKFIIDHIIENKQNHFQSLYHRNDWKCNFILITFKYKQIKFKCYRYDQNNNSVVNVFQPIQTYLLHQDFEIHHSDRIFIVRPKQIFSIEEQSKDKNSIYTSKVRQILEKGIYIFQSQSKRKMIKQFQNLKKNKQKHYFLRACQIDFHNMYIIIDFSKSYKRSKEEQKVKQNLTQQHKANQHKKQIQLSNMKINNSQLEVIQIDNLWIRTIKSINLSNNNISDISIILTHCTKIVELNVSINKFQKISFKQQLPNLIYIDASQNRLNRIKYLHHIKKIEVLNLKNNYLHQQSFQIFIGTLHRQFQHLREINLAFNNFTNLQELKQNAQCLNKVHSIDLKGNNFRNFQKIQFEDLQHINLADNLISEISDFENSVCKNLRKISLKNNCLTRIPHFKGMQHLESVDISYNFIQSIQQFAKGSYYKNLTHFYVTLRSKTKDLSLHFSEQSKLKVFAFPYSQLNDQDVRKLIDLHSESFKQLSQLYLPKNNLKHLPNISKLPKLSLLSLEQNPIQQIPKNENKKPPKDLKNNDKQRIYEDLKYLWISIVCNNDNEFLEKRNDLKNYVIKQFTQVKNEKKHKKQIKKVNEDVIDKNFKEKVICWKYIQNKEFYQQTQIQNKKSKIFSRQSKPPSKCLLRKSLYLLEVFSDQLAINERCNFQTVNQFQFNHSQIPVDINEFLRYDWTQLNKLNLKGAIVTDTKLGILLLNYHLFPRLYYLNLSGNQFKQVPQGAFQRFAQLKQIIFYQSGRECNLSSSSISNLNRLKGSIKVVLPPYANDDDQENYFCSFTNNSIQ